MKWLLVLAIVLPLTQQPAEPPREKGPAESNRSIDAGQTKHPKENQQPSIKAAPAQAQLPITVESKTESAVGNGAESANSKQTPNEGLRIQRELAWFTGALVVVGFLQFFALVGQVTIYRRQAKIMAHQASEIERQRITMSEQLETMNGQLLQMESAGKQTNQIIEHASRQVSAAEGQVRLMERSGTYTEDLARQAVRQADLTQRELELAHRPWIAVDVAPDSAVIFDERGCVMMCKVTMTNVGHSVAKHVSLWTDFAVLGLDDPIKVRDRLCDIMRQPQNENSDYGWLLFPSQKAVEHRPVIASPENVHKAMDMKVFQGLNAIGLHLVGCVDYPSPIDPQKRHQTRFVYSVAYVDTPKGRVMGAFDPSVKMYPNITLLPTMHGASAD